MKLVETQALCVTLHGGGMSHAALTDVNLCVHVGQHIALLGPNGAGKSTLLKVLQGTQWPDQRAPNSVPPSAPPVIWYPPPHEQGETSPLVGRAMSALVSAAQHEQYVRQAWDLCGAELLLTGFDDSPLLYTLPQPKQEQAVQAVAHKLGLEHLLHRSITTLSQGQMRLLLLARAVVRQPALLLLDECLDGLDPASRERLMHLLDEVRHSATIIVTSHRQHSLPAWMHTSLHMRDGRIYSQAPALSAACTGAKASPPPCCGTLPHETSVSNVPTAPLPPLAAGVPDTMGTTDTAGTTGTTGAKGAMGTTGKANKLGVSTGPPQLPLVSLRNVNVYVERAHVLHDVNWCVRQGEHWLLRGANGSGKSTLLRLLAGDEYPAVGGSIERHLPRSMGHTGTICELELLRRGIRLVSNALQAGYDYDLSAQELVLSGFDGSIGVYRDFSPAEYREALYWMRRVGMDALAQRTLRSLSTGQARRLFIARALVGRPDILLLDEPCSGLDNQSRTDVLAMLSGLAADNIHTILVSHHGEDRLSCCNREATVVEGRFHAEPFVIS